MAKRRKPDTRQKLERAVQQLDRKDVESSAYAITDRLFQG